MSFLSAAFGAVVLGLVLLRQARVVPVPRLFQPRLPVFLGILGLFSLFSYTGDHHVSGAAWTWFLGTLAVGALGLGALRGLSMRVWTGNGWVLRQGTTVTMALWLASLMVHLVAGSVGSQAASGGVTGLLGAGFLLYLGMTLAVQYGVLHRRAEPLWVRLGPDAGRPLRVNVTQGPGIFFTSFRTGPGGPAGAWPGTPDPHGEVIDAEVVEDEDGPSELRGPN